MSQLNTVKPVLLKCATVSALSQSNGEYCVNEKSAFFKWETEEKNANMQISELTEKAIRALPYKNFL